MKIAIISQPHDTLYPVKHNSSEYWSQQVAQRLKKSAEITLFGRRDKNQHRPSFSKAGVHYRFIRSHINRFFTNPERTSSLFYGVTYGIKIGLILQREQFDIVHIHGFSNLVTLIRALNPRIRILLHTNQAPQKQRSKKLKAAYITQCDLIVSNSKKLRDLLRSDYPQFSNRFTYIYNGVDSARFYPTNTAGKAINQQPASEHKMLYATRVSMARQFGLSRSNIKEIDQTHFATIVPTPNSRDARQAQTILYVGDLTPEQGVHDLIDAFAQISAHFPQIKLELIGSTNPAIVPSNIIPALTPLYIGDYLEHLKKRIPKHLKKRIVFHKPLAQAELISRYQACNLVIHAGYSGGYNMSLAEAGACGKPVIATTALINADIVRDGETGFVVEPGEVYLLAQAIGILLQDVKEQARMGQNGRVRVKYLFEWDQVAITTISIYRYLLEPQQTPMVAASTI